MLAGWIDDSMFDGCYVFYSARQDPNTQADGTGRTVKVTNSLIRMEAMPHVFEGTAPGHGPIWKMGNGLTGGRTGISPTLSIHNTIIRADQLPAHGHLNIPKYDHDTDSNTPMISYLDPANCSNNTIVWLGDEEDMSTEDWEASYPSSCFEVVTDVSVWNDAVAAWNATHP
jgi:hypothetical protein